MITVTESAKNQAIRLMQEDDVLDAPLTELGLAQGQEAATKVANLKLDLIVSKLSNIESRLNTIESKQFEFETDLRKIERAIA